MPIAFFRVAVVILGCAILCARWSAAADQSAPLETTIQVGGGEIDLSAPEKLPVSNEAVLRWVHRAADALTDFYGHYPVRRVRLAVLTRDEGAVGGGKEFGGRRINIHLGPDTTSSELDKDWMLTHEMFHLSQPDLDVKYSWMSEGMADYLEPVARVRVGQITPEKFWRDLVDGLPQGLPEAGDRGLDHTHTWGRTYWGGGLYWLLADIEVRKQTHNQKSVRDAAQAALNEGGDGSHVWSLDRLLDAYDRGTGTEVFKSLHDQMGSLPHPVDLHELWKSLGIVSNGDRITFDDAALLAEIRKGITARL